jgi:2-keto-3-deoxy-L-rhamnonate aldolase RhmA
VANIDAIVATTGLDGLVIGPSDLSADLDCPNDFAKPAYGAAFVAIERAATRAGLILGSVAHTGFDLERLLAAGHCFIRASSDVMALRDGLLAHLGATRRP